MYGLRTNEELFSFMYKAQNQFPKDILTVKWLLQEFYDKSTEIENQI